MIPPEVIDEVVSRTDLAQLVGQYVTLKKAGRSLKGLCPFHNEKTPSFVVTPDKGIFKCFGCGVGGGPIQFLMKIESLDFLDAVKALAKSAGVSLPSTPAQRREVSERDLMRKVMETAVQFYQEQLKSSVGRQALGYLRGRGLSPDVIDAFRLGFSPGVGNALARHLRSRKFEYGVMERAGLVRRSGNQLRDYFHRRVIFPILDPQGRPLGMGGRGMDPEMTPKYLNTPETSIFQKRNLLYGLHLAKGEIRREEEVFIVEGYMDAIAMHGGGIKNVAASMGTALSVEQARTAARYANRVIFAYDADSAGQAATLRGIEIFETEGLNVRVITMPTGEDPDSIIKKKGAEFFRKLSAKSRGIVNYKIDQLTSILDLSTPEGKQQLVNQITPILRKVRGDVRRMEYVRMISGRYRISEELLQRAVSRQKVRISNLDVSPVMRRRRLSAQEKLIAQLFSHPGLLAICRQYDYFDERHMEPDLLAIYRALLNLDVTGLEVITSEQLYKLSRNEEIIKKAVDLSMVEGLPRPSEEEIRAILREIDIREKKHRLHNLQEVINLKLERGEMAPGDPQFEEFNRLQMEIRGPRE